MHCQATKSAQKVVTSIGRKNRGSPNITHDSGKHFQGNCAWGMCVCDVKYISYCRSSLTSLRTPDLYHLIYLFGSQTLLYLHNYQFQIYISACALRSSERLMVTAGPAFQACPILAPPPGSNLLHLLVSCIRSRHYHLPHLDERTLGVILGPSHSTFFASKCLFHSCKLFKKVF